MANDPHYDSRLMIDGTASAAEIYNELIARFAAGQSSVKSATTFTPPVSPTNGDAYYLNNADNPPTGVWVDKAGEIAIYINGWVFMTPKVGFRFHIFDEKYSVVFNIAWDGSTVEMHALDGRQVGVIDTGTVDWDCSRGRELYVLLDENVILQRPTNMTDGVQYLLVVQQDDPGSRTLDYESLKFFTPGGAAPVPNTAVNTYSTYLFEGRNDPAEPVFELLRVQNQLVFTP